MTITDDTANHRFLLTEDGLDAELVYRDESGHLFLTHTEVPPALGGRGIGGRLVAAVVERAATTGEVVHPWCSFTRAWLERNPEAAARIQIDWGTPGR